MRRSLPGPLATALCLMPLSASAQSGRVHAGILGLVGGFADPVALQPLGLQGSLELRSGR